MQLAFRMKSKLEAAENIVLHSRAKRGHEPALVLNKSINAPLRTNLPDKPCAGVALRASAGQESGTGLDIPIANLQGTSRRKMINTRDVIGTSVAPSLVPEEKAFVQ